MKSTTELELFNIIRKLFPDLPDRIKNLSIHIEADAPLRIDLTYYPEGKRIQVDKVFRLQEDKDNLYEG